MYPGFIVADTTIVITDESPETSTVTFVTNGGSEIDSVKVPYATALEKPAAPTKKYYKFEGWFTDEELTKNMIFRSWLQQILHFMRIGR